MKEADADGNGVVSFAELVSLMHRLKKDPSSASSVFVRKIHKAPAQVRLCVNGGKGCWIEGTGSTVSNFFHV